MSNQQHPRRRRSIETPTLSPILLPHDLILQILLRLPVRSLLRFKSVCKSWRSLISEPQFGKLHFDLAAAPTHRCLINNNDSAIESLDLDAYLHNYESSVVNLKYPLSTYPHDDRDYPVVFLGSCRGFILVVYPEGDVYVWNPSTGVHRRIIDYLDDINYLFLHGFGYDTSTDDYLLVLIEVICVEDYRYSHPDVIATIPTRIRFFSVTSNSWVYLQGTYAQYVDMVDHEFKVGSLLNEALHWLIMSYETDLLVIIAFDLVQRTLLEIPLSKNLAKKLNQNHKQYDLRVMGECLSLCHPGNAASMAEIWIMKKYKVASSWTKLFVFSTYNIPHNVFYPICFSKHGRVFGSNGNGRLMILTDKGWLLYQCTTCPDADKYVELDICRTPNREYFLHRGIYRETLLSLPNYPEKAREDGQPTGALEEVKMINTNWQ